MPSSASAGRQRAHEVFEAVCDLFERHPAVLAQVGDELGPETDEQRVACVVGVEVGSRFAQQRGEVEAIGDVRTGPDSFAFAVDPQGSLAGREADVVDVEADDLADPCAGAERGERGCRPCWP